MEFGEWEAQPPEVIKPGETTYFGSKSTWRFTGTTASIAYGNNQNNINFSVRWVNPLIDGDRGKYCDLMISGDESYALSHSITQGEHNQLDITLSSATA